MLRLSSFFVILGFLIGKKNHHSFFIQIFFMADGFIFIVFETNMNIYLIIYTVKRTCP